MQTETTTLALGNGPGPLQTGHSKPIASHATDDW